MIWRRFYIYKKISRKGPVYHTTPYTSTDSMYKTTVWEKHIWEILLCTGDDIMYFTDCCRFLISSAFKLTELCTILPHCVQSFPTVYNLTALCTIFPHCVQSYRTVYNLTALCRYNLTTLFTILPHWGLEGGGDGPWNLSCTEPGWLAYLGPMYIKSPMDVFFIQPCT